MSQPLNEMTRPSVSPTLPASEWYSVLAVKRRRLALDILAEAATAITLDELAAEIAAREGESNTADEETIEHVTVALHHTHLPKLVDAGIIHYDPDDHLIEAADRLTEDVDTGGVGR